ncbi:unnamed protein product [Fusarium equiseti]|uniref:Uncharacterized protein n=1 Tax=Fusarium equiseti TaxID=61235 RepID=A0A8J2NGT2_FUSEQ|nr:unnamed protein product [Fusarium equiseti]
MSSKRPRVVESPDEVDIIPSVESLLREQHQQLLDALTRLEAHNRQDVAESEKRINDLKRQIQELRSENESHHTTNNSLPELAVVPQEQYHLAQQFDRITKIAPRLDLRIQEPKGREVEVLFLVLCNDRRLAHLERFLQAAPSQSNRSGHRYCVEEIGEGYKAWTAILGQNGGRSCGHKTEGDYVWITKREIGWVIGSGLLSWPNGRP